ncbi:MAG: metallophosphoesterase [Christensenellaceae bacterium]|jgi:3',5'-cyclic AMP phosphodiesterase CpdA|nr:metallophosphoesterase [Christensenellaceae bacterium]
MPDFSEVKPIKLTVITDIHYYSKTLGTTGKAYMKYDGQAQLLAAEAAEVIREAWDLICADTESDTVLISGDITRHGDFASHAEVIPLLRELQARGKRIILTFSTHDYRQPTDNELFARSYDGDVMNKIPCFMQEDIVGKYDEFGRSEAIALCPTTFSYVAQISDGIRLLALDDDKWGIVGNGYWEEHLQWIEEQVKDAHANNQYIFAMAHHPVLPPSPLYSIIGKKTDIIQDYREVFQRFADMGLSLFFTGHSHIHDISYNYSANGNIFYDVSTSALVGAPPAIRKVVLDPSNDIVKVTTEIIQSCKYFDTDGLSLPDYIKRNFFGRIENFIKSGAEGDFEVFATIADSMSIREATSKKFWFIIKPVFRYINKLTVKKIARWTKAETKLKKADFAALADERVVPFIMNTVVKMFAGDPNNAPDGKHYKIAMALMAVADSLIKCLPIKFKKITGFDSVCEIVDPMIYNSGICDDNADLIIDNEKASKLLPKTDAYIPPFKSTKGWKIIAIAVLSMLVLSPILIPSAIIVLIVLFISKLKKV